MTEKCPNCGRKKDKRTGLCPACDAPAAQSGKIAAVDQKAAGSKKSAAKVKKSALANTMRTAIIVICAVVLFCVTLILLVAFDVIRIPALNGSTLTVGMTKEGDKEPTSSAATQAHEYLDPDAYSDDEIRDALEKLLAPCDADAYFDSIGTVAGKIPAGSSKSVLSDREVRTLMEERGFGEYSISAEYDMRGNYHDASEIGSGSDRHPYYRLVYQDSQDRLWLVFATNGVVYATLLSYNVEHPEALPVIVAETDTLMGYDGSSNTFYEYTLHEDTAVVAKVDVISAEALDAFII